jgi:hypothetical protein
MTDKAVLRSIALQDAPHDGFCEECEGLIAKGERITIDNGHWRHFACALEVVTPQPTTEVRNDSFMGGNCDIAGGDYDHIHPKP